MNTQPTDTPNTQEQYNELWKLLDQINTIMWESYMIQNNEFGREQGKEIMERLEKWANNH